MKQLNFEIALSKNKTYTVYAGNKDWLLFKSKTFVDKWLKKYKALILDNVKLLNLYHSNINTIYRTYYFEFDDLTSHKLTESLNDINSRFNFIFDTFSEGNQNAFTFSNIMRVNAMMLDFCTDLKQFAQTHKNYSLKHSISPLIKALYQLEKTIESERISLNLDNGYTKIVRLHVSNDKKKTI